MPSHRQAEPAPPQATRRVLIFEPDAEGHAHEWLQHLIHFVANGDAGVEIWILVPERLRSALAETISTDCARLIALTAAEERFCATRLLTVSAFARWWVVRRHLRRIQADRGFFLMLDLLSLPLALGLGAAGARLSGILFRPSVHYREIGPYRPSLAERLRDLRKALLYRLMLRNPSLDRVFSLDPFFPAYARTHYRLGEKVLALPDPVHPLVGESASDDAGDFTPAGRVGFLLFGYLTERKGPLAVLDALDLVPPEIAARLAILFAGRIDPALRDRLQERRRILAARHPDLWLRFVDRRLEDAELASLVRRSDVILAPYQRFVGSSGVLLWAAQNGRPVLAQEYGLVGRLTREHRLGMSVDAGDPARLAAAITHMVRSGPSSFIDRSAASRFAATQTPQRFASLVLSV
jgi:glycosyltransferase involved in cell wall biosynthesis